MNRKAKKELRERQSTRQLMGISQLTEHGVKTAGGELVFFMLSPDNLSVLSPEGVQARVTALGNLLRTTPAVRLQAMDSRESFQANKDFYQRRLETEPLPAVRDLLRQDAAHLDEIQAATASAREFALVYPVDIVATSSISLASPQAAKLTHSAAAPHPTRTASLGSHGDPSGAADPRLTEKNLRDAGFQVRLADGQDVKRILAVYYQQDVTTELFLNFDGEGSVNTNG